MSSEGPLRVSFTHRVPRVGEVLVSAVHLEQRSRVWAHEVGRRATTVRVALGVVVAVGLAALTQALGLPLAAGLCTFMGALPMVWLAGWIASLLLELSRVRARVAERFEPESFAAKVEQYTEEEALTLVVTDDGLSVTSQRAGGAALNTVAPWQTVRLERESSAFALLAWGGPPARASATVPASAFPSAADFDAFCLAVQAKQWAADRAIEAP